MNASPKSFLMILILGSLTNFFLATFPLLVLLEFFNFFELFTVLLVNIIYILLVSVVALSVAGE